MVARHKMSRSQQSDAVGGLAEDPSCLFVVSASVINRGTKDCYNRIGLLTRSRKA